MRSKTKSIITINSKMLNGRILRSRIINIRIINSRIMNSRVIQKELLFIGKYFIRKGFDNGQFLCMRQLSYYDFGLFPLSALFFVR